MSLALTGSSRVGIVADSLAIPFTAGAIPFQYGFEPLLRARYGSLALAGSAVRRLPFFYADGAAGRSAFNIAATIGTVLAGMPKNLTHIIVQLGINDADAIRTGAGGENISNCTTAATTIRDACAAIVGGPNLAWIGPWGSLAGIDATQIAQVDAAFSPLLAAISGTYITWSGVTNLGGAAIADGTHPTTIGAAALGTQTMLNLSVAA